MTAPRATDPLNLLLNGRPAPFVPVAPVYETLGPLQFHWMEQRHRKWRARLDQTGTDLLPVDHATHFSVQWEIHTETLDHYYLPPAWYALPWTMSPEEAAGCAVARQGDDLYWTWPSGEMEWMPPNRQAYHDTQTAERTMPYAQLWQRGHHVDALAQALAEPRHRLDPTPEPAPVQAEAIAASARWELARRLLDRYPSNLPLYWYASSPYNSLLGMLGFQDMMTTLLERPEAVHHLLERKLPQPSATLAGAQRLGVGIVFIEECLASADLISPRMYQEFVFPYTKRTIEFYEQRGFRTVLYFSGNLMPFLGYLKELPWTALSFEENRKNYGIDLAEVRRVMGPDRVLFGNLDAMFVQKATDEQLPAEVRRQIEVAGKHGNFVVSLGSPFTPGTALSRVRLVCESTQKL